jgi:ribosomal protein L36
VTIHFLNALAYHGLLKADLQVPVKEYRCDQTRFNRRNASLSIINKKWKCRQSSDIEHTGEAGEP